MNDNNTIVLNFDEHKALVQGEVGPVNRAALFGDGVFETMIFLNGKIRFAREHGERMENGLRLLKIIPSGLTIHDIEQYIQQHFQEESSLRIRWNAYRGGLGKYTPLVNHAQDQVLIQAAHQPDKVKYKAYINNSIRMLPSPWSECKTLNGLPYVMANIERKELGMDEVILLDDQGFVSEAGSANIFWIKDRVVYTPSLSCNCIAGVGRRKILEALGKAGHHFFEGKFTVEELLEAEQAFTSNVTGIAYIADLEGKLYDITPLPVVEQLFNE